MNTHMRLTMPIPDAIQHLQNLIDDQSWQEFCGILRANDIQQVMEETDAELFASLGDIPPERMKAIAGLRYRAAVMREMLTMPEKLMAALKREIEEPENAEDEEKDDQF